MFLPVEKTPVFTREYLKNEAEFKEELIVKVILGSLVSRAGFESETEQSEAKVNRVSPMAREAAVVMPRMFQVLMGASSSYWPRTN